MGCRTDSGSCTSAHEPTSYPTRAAVAGAPRPAAVAPVAKLVAVAEEASNLAVAVVAEVSSLEAVEVAATGPAAPRRR